LGGLLAREPRPARRWPAGAVANGARQAGAGLDETTPVRVEPQRRRATGGAGVVRGAPVRERGAVTLFVVAHEDDAASGGERGHAVVRARGGTPVAHAVVRPAEAHVLEP